MLLLRSRITLRYFRLFKRTLCHVQSRNQGSNATEGILERVTFSMPPVSFEVEKIKRASILVLTFYRKIRTLTMVIR